MKNGTNAVVTFVVLSMLFVACGKPKKDTPQPKRVTSPVKRVCKKKVSSVLRKDLAKLSKQVGDLKAALAKQSMQLDAREKQNVSSSAPPREDSIGKKAADFTSYLYHAAWVNMSKEQRKMQMTKLRRKGHVFRDEHDAMEYYVVNRILEETYRQFRPSTRFIAYTDKPLHFGRHALKDALFHFCDRGGVKPPLAAWVYRSIQLIERRLKIPVTKSFTKCWCQRSTSPAEGTWSYEFKCHVPSYH